MAGEKNRTLYGKEYDVSEQEKKETIVRLKQSLALLRHTSYRWMHKPAMKLIENKIKELSGVVD